MRGGREEKNVIKKIPEIEKNKIIIDIMEAMRINTNFIF